MAQQAEDYNRFLNLCDTVTHYNFFMKTTPPSPKISLRWFLVFGSLFLFMCQAASPQNFLPSSGFEADSTAVDEPQDEVVENVELSIPAVDQIAFMGTDRNLYVINPDGSGEVALTDNANFEGDNGFITYYRLPVWSPDSEKIAYWNLSHNMVAGTSQTTMYVHRLADDDVTNVFSSSNNFPIYASWSPDSTKISFIANSTGEENVEFGVIGRARGLASPMKQMADLDFIVVDVEGSDAPQYIDIGAPYYWQWSPTGDGLLTHVNGSSITNDQARIALMQQDGTRDQLSGLMAGSFRAPSWSPDGLQILVAVDDMSNNESTLVLTDLQGNIQQKLANYSFSVAFTWSPTGEWIAYIESLSFGQETVGALVLVNPSDPDDVITLKYENVMSYFWSPDGSKLAYFSIERDGDRSSRSFDFLVNVYDLETRETMTYEFVPTEPLFEVIPYFDQYHHSATIWSPDSTKIVVPARVDGQAVIQVLDTTNGFEPETIANGLIAFWSWR